jgi:hypothetical protein
MCTDQPSEVSGLLGLSVRNREIEMKRLLAVWMILACAFAASGCSTMADASAAKGSGASRTYDKPYDVVWDAAIATIQSTSLTIESQNKASGQILAKGSVGLFTWGENVAVNVEDAGGRVKTRVEIINKRVATMNVTANDWESRLFQALDQRLK